MLWESVRTADAEGMTLQEIQEQLSLDKDFTFDEMYLNRIGYSWMRKGNNSEAIEIFKLNTEAFPQSFNAYDSLGEVYMNIGDTKNATNNYKKSLELNPDNKNAENFLETLETK